METVLLVDGSDLLVSVMRNKVYRGTKLHDGTEIGGVLGTVSYLHKALEKFLPHRCIMVWDRDVDPVKKEFFPNYRRWYHPFSKSKKKNSWKSRYDEQKGLVDTVLSCLGVESFEQKGYEARDLIGWMAQDPVHYFLGETPHIIVVSQMGSYLGLVSSRCSFMDPFAETVVKDEHAKVMRGERELIRRAVVGDEDLRTEEIPELKDFEYKLSKTASHGDFCNKLWLEGSPEEQAKMGEYVQNFELLKFKAPNTIPDEVEAEMEAFTDSQAPEANGEAAMQIFSKYQLYKFEKDMGGFLAAFKNLGVPPAE